MPVTMWISYVVLWVMCVWLLILRHYDRKELADQEEVIKALSNTILQMLDEEVD